MLKDKSINKSLIYHWKAKELDWDSLNTRSVSNDWSIEKINNCTT